MLRSRYRRITLFFARTLLSLAVWELIFPRLGLRGWSARTRSRRLREAGAGFRSLAVQMGGVMIKLGQFLSARVDVLPEEITLELSGLQDEVPPEEFEAIRRVAEAEFGVPLEDKFNVFEEAPLAAASLGQAHLAQFKLDPQVDEGEAVLCPVVVKIQRPDIEALIDIDLAALRTVGGWVQRYPPIRRRANISALMDEFTRILGEEVDYLAEGQHAETFSHHFKDQPEIRVPKVYWSHTTRRVLTLEDVWAIKINEYDEITKAGIDRGEVARRLLNTYLKQIFEDGFFHADPHPGNLFVRPGENWQLTFVDFGMVGRLKPEMKAGMREMVIAVGTRDPKRLIHSYQMLGILLPGANLELLEQAETVFFDRFWGRNMTQLAQISLQEVSELALQFRELLYNMPFQVPEDLILLGRTIGILSGMCTGLDPEFNVWEAVAPFARKLIAEDIAASQEPLWDVVSGTLRRLIVLPARTEALLEKIERGELNVRDPKLVGQVSLLEKALRRAAGSIVFAALFLGGVQLLLSGQSPIAEIVLAGAGVALIWIILSGRARNI
jgi:predicted unusual protein kinase regulating ubiquinone biosynthesis (AarF/ABC1/UbiB family)